MRIRAFVALNFSLAVTRRMVEEVERLKPAVLATGAQVAWVPAANLHLTLFFAGSVPEELIEGMASRLGKVAAGHDPFELKARGLGAFPSHERPRVLWVGVEPPTVGNREALTRLEREVRAALIELGL